MGDDSIFNEILSLIVTLIGIGVVLFLTYKCTSWMGNKMGAVYSSRYMNIIDRMPLGQNKFVAIMKVKDEAYLIGVTENTIEILKELEGDFDLADTQTGKTVGPKFSDVIKKTMRKANKNEPYE